MLISLVKRFLLTRNKISSKFTSEATKWNNYSRSKVSIIKYEQFKDFDPASRSFVSSVNKQFICLLRTLCFK